MGSCLERIISIVIFFAVTTGVLRIQEVPTIPNSTARPSAGSTRAPEPTPRATRAVSPRPTELRPKTSSSGQWNISEASWYGKPFFGSRTACGQIYTREIIGVAHKSLPCGTRVVFRYGGREVTTTVIDRGPYVAGRVWDLSRGLCLALAHCFTGPVR